MKIIGIILLLSIFTGCGSQPKKNMLDDQRQEIEAHVKEDKIHGDPLPDWVNSGGIENGRVYAVGVASMPSERHRLWWRKLH